MPGQPDFRPRLSSPDYRCDISSPNSWANFGSGQTGESYNSRLPFCSQKATSPPRSVYILCRPEQHQHVRTLPDIPPVPVATGSVFPGIPWGSAPHTQGLAHPFAKTLPFCYSAVPSPPRLTSPIDQKGEILLIKPEPMDMDETVVEKPADFFPPRRDSLDQAFSQLFSLQTQLTRVLDAFTLTCGKLNPTSERVKDLVLIHQVKHWWTPLSPPPP